MSDDAAHAMPPHAALAGALIAVVRAHAARTGEPEFLAASIASALLRQHADISHEKYAAERGGVFVPPGAGSESTCASTS